MSTAAAPLAFAVLFREHRPRARWRPVAVVADEYAALATSSGRGDWTCRPLWSAAEVEEAQAAVARHQRATAPHSRQAARHGVNAAPDGSG